MKVGHSRLAATPGKSPCIGTVAVVREKSWVHGGAKSRVRGPLTLNRFQCVIVLPCRTGR